MHLDVTRFHTWQARSFGAHGAKGVHIGPHATLYTDSLLHDMGLCSGHVSGTILSPVRFLREWFRPMYPEIYAGVGNDREERDKRVSMSGAERDHKVMKGPAGLGRIPLDGAQYFFALLFLSSISYFLSRLAHGNVSVETFVESLKICTKQGNQTIG